MDQSNNYKHKIDFLISNTNDISLIQQTPTIIKERRKKIHCSECNKRRKPLDESHQICHVCYRARVKELKLKIKLSGNKIIDDFIIHTQINLEEDKMEFVSYDQFKNIKFIAEGGFSKIYKATWIDGPVTNYYRSIRQNNCTVVLKKLNNSKNITSKELNEVRTIIIILY